LDNALTTTKNYVFKIHKWLMYLLLVTGILTTQVANVFTTSNGYINYTSG